MSWFPVPDESRGPTNGVGPHDAPEWADVLARSIAHLAAQLTTTQLRLRALATEVAETSTVDAEAVNLRLREIAHRDAGTYLREILGEAMTEIVDVDELEARIIAFLETETTP